MTKAKKPTKVKAKRAVEKRPGSNELDDSQLDRATGGADYYQSTNTWNTSSTNTSNTTINYDSNANSSGYWYYKQ
jgi:hypothetical protein